MLKGGGTAAREWGANFQPGVFTHALRLCDGRKSAGGEESLPEVWGYVALNAVHGAGLAWIAELAVAPAHRRRGLGRLLLDAARAWARAPVAEGGAGGLPVLMVELSPRNYPAIAFCRRQGP